MALAQVASDPDNSPDVDRRLELAARLRTIEFLDDRVLKIKKYIFSISDLRCQSKI